MRGIPFFTTSITMEKSGSSASMEREMQRPVSRLLRINRNGEVPFPSWVKKFPDVLVG
jgi:hypothetical protein